MVILPDSETLVIFDNTACINGNLSFKLPLALDETGERVIEAHTYAAINEFLGFQEAVGFTTGRFVEGGEDLFKQNIHKAVSQLFTDNGLGSALQMMPSYVKELKEEIEDKLEAFESQVRTLNHDKVSDIQLNTIRRIFEDNEKDLGPHKESIPEDEDLMIINSTKNNDGYTKKMILSHDRHFTEYSTEINDEFSVFIIWENNLVNYNKSISDSIEESN